MTQVHIPRSNTQLKVIMLILPLHSGAAHHESEPTADVLSGNQSITGDVTRELHMHREFPQNVPEFQM